MVFAHLLFHFLRCFTDKPNEMRLSHAFNLAVFVATVFLGLSLVQVNMACSADVSERDGLREVQAAYGRVLSHTEAPKVYETLNLLFDRLVKAQKAIPGAHQIEANFIHVLECPVENTFVLQTKENRTHVFVTTGFLDKFFSNTQSESDLEDATHGFAGWLSHELSHPIEALDPDGFTQRLGSKKTYSQAIELRVDAEAMAILKNANIPPNSLYRGMSLLFSSDQDPASNPLAAFSTHPVDDLRTTAQRLIVTTDRFQKGLASTFPVEVLPGFVEQVRNVANDAKLATFFTPKSSSIVVLSNALKRELGGMTYDDMGKLPKGGFRGWQKIIKFNRILLDLDRAIAAKNASPLSPAELQALRESFPIIAQAGGRELIIKKDYFVRAFSKDTASEDYASLPDHYESIRKAPFWRSDQFVRVVENNLDALMKGVKENAATPDTLLAHVLPMDRLIADRTEQLKEEILNPKIFNGLPSCSNWLPLEAQLEYSKFYRSVLYGGVSEEEFTKVLLNPGKYYRVNTFVYPVNRLLDQTDKSSLLTRIKSNPRFLSLAHEFAEFWWKNRAVAALSSIDLPNHDFDWDLIFEILGINPTWGYAEIKKSVVAYTRSESYPRFLKELQGRPIAQKKLTVPWFSDDILPDLLGNTNPMIRANSEFLNVAKAHIGQVLLQGNKHLLNKLFESELANLIRNKGASIHSTDELLALVRRAESTLAGETNEVFVEPSLSAVVSAIHSSDISDTLKREFFDKLLLNSDSAILPDNLLSRLTDKGPAPRGLNYLLKQGNIPVLYWANSKISGEATLVEMLQRDGYLGNVLALLTAADNEVMRSAKNTDAAKNLFYSLAADLRVPLIREIELSPDKKTLLLRLTSIPSKVRGSGKKMANTPELHALNEDILRLAQSVPLTPSERMQIFTSVTRVNPTSSSDNYFKTNILNTQVASEEIEIILEEGRIASPQLQTHLTELVLQTKIDQLSGEKNPSERAVKSIFYKINQYMPKSFHAKDEFLEKFAWRLNLSGAELLRWVENSKSYSKGKYEHPLLVNAASEIVENVRSLSRSDRDNFLKYLIDPDRNPLPNSVFDEIERKNIAELLPGTNPQYEDQVKDRILEGVSRLKSEFEINFQGLTPTERIPLIEIAITSGPGSLNKASDYPLGPIRKYLGYKPESIEEKLLVAYLRAVPEHERSVSLAYLFSQLGSEKGSVNSLFEVFQTVGIKFGQMSSLWKVFGDEVANETQSLKDSAAPLGKYEIEQVLQSSFSPEELKKIDHLEKVVGSASLKTVVKARLTDGREVVFLIQRPFADNQVRTNLALSRQFIIELRKEGVELPKGMFDAILADLESQLNEELDMTLEAKKIKIAKAFYEKMNSTLKFELQGWHFNVPDLVEDFTPRKNILVLKNASGVNWNSLSSSAKEVTGAPIVESSLRGIFSDGWFNPDPHGGNYIFDEGSRVIHPIDFGQAESFSKGATDDRYVFAQFIRAVEDEDPKRVLNYALRMSAPTHLSLDGRRGIESQLKKIFREGRKDPSEKIVGIMNKLAEEGIDADRRFRFGALKGLMMLSGENYVNQAEFKSRLTRQIRDAIFRKAPQALLEGAKSGVQCIVETLTRSIVMIPNQAR